MKQCTKCKKEYALWKFPFSKGKLDSSCKLCKTKDLKEQKIKRRQALQRIEINMFK